MKKKQGFTLIELLAIIVILAVIALITTPLILGVIEKAKKGALEDTAYGLIDSANIYFAEGILDESQSKTEFIFEDGKQTSEKKLSYKGKVEKGSLRLFSDGKNALCISDGNNSAVKNVNDKKVKVVTGRCSYNSETDEYETVGVCQDLQDELEELKRKHQEKLDRLKKEYEDALAKLTEDNQAILNQMKKDHETQIKTIKEAYEAQIAELNRQLNIFKTGGTAIPSQILAEQTAFLKGILVTGTMKNNGAVNANIGLGKIYTIPEGYHDGKGTITSEKTGKMAYVVGTYTATKEGQVFVHATVHGGTSQTGNNCGDIYAQIFKNNVLITSCSKRVYSGVGSVEWCVARRVIDVVPGDIITVATIASTLSGYGNPYKGGEYSIVYLN